MLNNAYLPRGIQSICNRVQTNANRTIPSVARGQQVEWLKGSSRIIEGHGPTFVLGGCNWRKIRTKGSVTFEQRLS